MAENKNTVNVGFEKQIWDAACVYGAIFLRLSIER